MKQRQQSTAHPSADAEPKKRRRVGFTTIDAGVEANDCFKIYLDGKIYGYQGLKGGKGITDLKLALQSIFGETLVETKDDLLQTFSTDGHFIRNLLPSCTCSSVVSNGENLHYKAFNGDINCNSSLEATTSNVEVVWVVVGNSAAGHLYSHLVPLVLLLVDGSNPIDVTDPSWELYLLIQKNVDSQNT